MTPQVSIKDIVEGMGIQADGIAAYLHRPTGSIVTVSDEAVASAAAGQGEEAGVDDSELEDARDLLTHGDDYVQLPDRFEIDEYRLMERFARSVTDPFACTDLLQALRGRGAFRRFKETVRRHGLSANWYGSRDHGYEEVARAWCDEHKIALRCEGADL